MIMTCRLGFDFQGKLCAAQGNTLLLSSRPDPDFEPIWQFRPIEYRPKLGFTPAT